MTEFLDFHEIVDLDSFGLTDSVDIVSGKVDEHDVLCAIFL